MRLGNICINRLAFSSDTTLAAVGEDGVVYVIDASRMIVLFKLHGNGKELNTCEFFDADSLATAGENAKVTFWNMAQRKVIRTIDLKKPIVSISVLESKQLLAASLWKRPTIGDPVKGAQGEVIIYDLRSNESFPVVADHKSKVSYVRLLSDGQLITASLDGNVNLLDPKKKQPIRQWNHGHMVTSVAFGVGNKTIFSGGADGKVNRWDFNRA